MFAVPDSWTNPVGASKRGPGAASKKIVPLFHAHQLTRAESPSDWTLETLSGRFSEVSGGSSNAGLTACVQLILQAQQQGHLGAWVGNERSAFFPPDAAALGVDLSVLPVIRVETPMDTARVADTLLRSSAFAVIVLDLGSARRLPIAVQTRLVGLAKKHHTALVSLLRDAPQTAGGSLASLRVEAVKERSEHDCFACEIRATKDKRQAPGWRHVELCHGTDGLC